QPTPRRGARRLTAAAVDDHRAGHHVLGHANATVAVHADRRLLVHAGAVVTDVTVDLDLVGRVEPDRDGVPSARVAHDHPTAGAVGVDLVQPLVELPDGIGHKVERQDRVLGDVGGGHYATEARPQL